MEQLPPGQYYLCSQQWIADWKKYLNNHQKKVQKPGTKRINKRNERKKEKIERREGDVNIIFVHNNGKRRKKIEESGEYHVLSLFTTMDCDWKKYLNIHQKKVQKPGLKRKRKNDMK